VVLCIIVNVAEMCINKFCILTLGDKKEMSLMTNTIEYDSCRMHRDNVRATENSAGGLLKNKGNVNVCEGTTAEL